MINYGIQCSSVEPKSIEIIGSNVFVANNIQPYEEELDGRFLKGYKYNCVSYTKDEYILLIANKNLQLEQDLIDTQVALCDLYEALGGE